MGVGHSDNILVGCALAHKKGGLPGGGGGGGTPDIIWWGGATGPKISWGILRVKSRI